MVKLHAPSSYNNASDAERASQSNGCGPGGWKFDVVPDNLLGVDVVAACNIHDWMYGEGGGEDDREWADRIFLMNMKRLVRAAGGPLLPARLCLAWWYWRGVVKLGRPAFDYDVADS